MFFLDMTMKWWCLRNWTTFNEHEQDLVDNKQPWLLDPSLGICCCCCCYCCYFPPSSIPPRFSSCQEQKKKEFFNVATSGRGSTFRIPKWDYSLNRGPGMCNIIDRHYLSFTLLCQGSVFWQVVRTVKSAFWKTSSFSVYHQASVFSFT